MQSVVERTASRVFNSGHSPLLHNAILGKLRPSDIRSVRCFTSKVNDTITTTTTSTTTTNMYHGVYSIVVTPFLDTPSESLDLPSFRRCISFLKHTGCSGVTVAGVLGESNRITDWERQCLVETAADEIRRQEDVGSTPNPSVLKLCVGTTHTGTAATVALSQMAYDCGADGVMISPTKPAFGPQPSDHDILLLFQRVAEACPNLAIIIQDLPSLTGVYMSTSLLARIAHSIPTVQSIKLESPPTISRIAALRNDPLFQASHCTILCGLGALYSGFDVRQGISGFMTGFAFPEILVAMMDLSAQKNEEASFALYKQYLDLIVLEQQPGGLSIRKEIYRRRGLLDSTILRHPGGTIAPALLEEVDTQLHRSFPGVDLSHPLQMDYLTS